MKNFFKKIGATFYSSRLYLEARDNSTSKGLKFLFKFAGLISFVASIILATLYFSFLPQIKTWAFNYVNETYPEDLVVTIKDKTLTTNKTEPVVFPLSSKMNEINTNTSLKKNTLVLAPEENAFDLNLISKYDTYTVITSKAIIVENSSSEYRTYLLDYPNTEITKTKINDFIEKLINKFIPIALVFMIPMILWLILMLIFGQLLVLFFVSLLLYGIFQFVKVDLSYKEIYRMGVYSIVPVILVGIVLNLFQVGNFVANMLVMVAVVLYANRNIKKYENTSSEPQSWIQEVDKNTDTNTENFNPEEEVK